MSDSDLMMYFIIHDYKPYYFELCGRTMNWYGASAMKHITWLLELLAEGRIGVIKAVIRHNVKEYFPEFDELFN